MIEEILGTLPNYQAFLKVRESQRKLHVDLDFWRPYLEKLQTLVIPPKEKLRVNLDDTVTVTGNFHDSAQHEILGELIKILLPWRKGPFNLMGYQIESEWRSELKWSRIAPHIRYVKGARVADFGCNNGYYLFRLLKGLPELLLGFDPNGRFYYQYDLINRFIRSESIGYEVLGVEHAPLFPNFFDIILCMGVIYHRRDPIRMLQEVKDALRPGGTVILESITIPGPREFCLFPSERYSMMRNIWFVPTEGALVSWMVKSGFQNVEVIDTTLTTAQEQRKTKDAPYDSLEDFLDKEDRTKTVEGYPAPQRTIIKATN